MWILLVIFLFFISIYLSIKLRFKNYKINIKELLAGDKSGLFLSLATKIGVGSVIGTLSSIIIGGFSSVIWMIIFSLLSTSLIYSESKLGNIYKQTINNKNIGGPYFIIRNGLNNKYLSIISVIIILVLYSYLFQMIQINTISNILKNTLNLNNLCIILIIFCIISIIIRCDINTISKYINKIVPFKCILFIIICLFGIVSHFDELLFQTKILINNLLTFKSIFSGLVIGIKRSIFMNEILIGTTSISSGSDSSSVEVSTKYQIIGVYFISIVITLLITCLVLIYSYSHSLVSDYNLLIIKIFSYTNNKSGIYLITIILILFAFTTLLSGYYILESHINYLIYKKSIKNIIKISFLIILTLSSIIDSSFLWKYTDIFIFIMIIINSYSIIKLLKDVLK